MLYRNKSKTEKKGQKGPKKRESKDKPFKAATKLPTWPILVELFFFYILLGSKNNPNCPPLSTLSIYRDTPHLLQQVFLRPGQTDRQLVASGRKLNLRRDLRWSTKRTSKLPRKYSQVAQKEILRQTFSVANNRLMDVTILALTCMQI